MKNKVAVVGLLVLLGILAMLGGASLAQPQSDVIKPSKGDLRITPINHATLMLEFGGKVIYVDPGNRAEVAGKAKADVILITDVHADHQDSAKIDQLKSPSTVIMAPLVVAKTFIGAQAIANGEKTTITGGIEIEAVPMYNLTRGPEAGKLFHDKGRGNGYILTFGDKRLYLSGDTECIPEMKALKDIDVAFVCMNLPYTMTPGEAASCVNSFKPKVVYPYHYGQSNLAEFSDAVKGTPGVEVRLRNWY